MKFHYLIFLILCSPVISAQENLVPNPSFENKTYCPSNFNQQQLNILENWTQPSEGTPDYFHRCSKKVGVPDNLFGYQEAYEGDAYIGVVTYSPGKRNYREYLQCKLTRPLAAGETVCINMRVSPADYSLYVTDGIGLALTKEKIQTTRNEVIAAQPGLMNPRLNMLDQTEGWLLLSENYTARGGEQFVTIGNFKKDHELKILKRTREMGATETSNWSYVFIDKVEVRPVTRLEDCSCTLAELAAHVHDPPLQLEEFDEVTIDAVYFDYDQDLLTAQATTQLNDVKRMLRSNAYMQLEVMGHTDIIGTDLYNLDLSKRRAERVISYLADKGIDPQRLRIAYFGRSQPVADNSTDEGRALNRRVEFRVIEKKYILVQ